MKSIITLDNADQPFGFPQLNETGHVTASLIQGPLGYSSVESASIAITSSYPIKVSGYILTSADVSTTSLFLGENAGSGSISQHSNFLGVQAGIDVTNADYSNFVGTDAGKGATNANNSNFLGVRAGFQATNANLANFIGAYAGDSATGASNSNFIGNNAGAGATSAQYSNFIGDNAGNAADSATNSNFIGTDAGSTATNASDSNFIGSNAGNGATNANNSNFLGTLAGNQATDASFSNFLGVNAGNQATNAYNSNFIGENAGNSATDAYNSNFIGSSAGDQAISANNSNFLGTDAGINATNADSSNFIGANAGANAASANYSNFIGESAGTNATSASLANFIGSTAGQNATNAYNSNFLGQNAGQSATNADNSNFLGANAGANAASANYSNFLGYLAGYVATNAYYSNFLGIGAGSSAANANNSNFLGFSAGNSATDANNSNFLGTNAGVEATNAYNSNFLGTDAGNGATNAHNSNFLGTSAGYQATNANISNFIGIATGIGATNADNSNFLGHNAGFAAVNASNSNFLGVNAGFQATSASYSTLIGYQVGYNVAGGALGIKSNNIIIGTNITLPNNAINAINLGGILFGTGSYSSVIGNPFSGSANGRIGINVVDPAYSFEVSGTVAFRDLTNSPTATKVVLIDNNGQLYTTASSGIGGGGTPGGPDTSIQFNNNGTFSGSAKLKYDYVNSNVILTGSLLLTQSYISTVDYVDFTTGTDQTMITGRLGWNDSDGTLDIGLKGGNLNLLVGETEVAYAFNAETSSLTKGTVVFITGSQGNRISVKRAFATSDATSAGTLGFVAETITAGGTGFIAVRGVLNKLDTAAYPEGALVYLSSSAGQYTTVKPQAPIHEVRLGYIERSHATVGSIYVKVDNGYEIDELHDIQIISASSGDLLIRSSSLWVNSKQLTGSYTLSGSLTTTDGGITGSLQGTSSWATNALTASYVNTLNQSVIVSGSLTVSGSTVVRSTLGTGAAFQVLSGSSPILYAGTNISQTRVGIRTSTPLYSFDVNGNANFTPEEHSGYLRISPGQSSTWNNPTFFQTSFGSTLMLNNAYYTASSGQFIRATNGYAAGIQLEPSLGGIELFTAPYGTAGTSFASFTSRITITNSGSVGINDTSPSYTLDVSGSGNYSNGLTVTGSLNAPSITGSLQGTASWANNVLASGVVGLNLSQIASGSVTASVTPSQFSIVSGSSTEFVVTGTGVTIGSATTDIHRITGSVILTGSLTVTGQTKIGTSTYVDPNSTMIIGKNGSSAAARGIITADNNYQDFGFVKTNIAAGNINSWQFGQRYDTFFGNATGSFQIIGSYTDNSGNGSAVGGGYRVPIICNPDGTVIIAGASANSVNGNVLVGTATDAGFKLDVNGSTRISGSASSVNPALTVTGATQTGSNAIGVLDMSQTWNTTGNVTGIKYSVTDTLSSATSLLMDLQVGATSQFKVSKAGLTTALGQITSTAGVLNLGSSNVAVYSATSRVAGAAGRSLYLRTNLNTVADDALYINNATTLNISTGTQNAVTVNDTIAYTTGTGSYNAINIPTTISSSAAASGSTVRGLYINPTFTTTVGDYRSIETTAGRVILASSAFTSSVSQSILSYFTITGSMQQVATTSSQMYAVNIVPSITYTAPSQTNTAFRVSPTFSGSTALTASQQNIIADFGATSVGSQFVVNDITSGSIYQVNDVSGLPIIEATSNWDVNIYDYPGIVFKKTGSAIIISGSQTITGAFSLIGNQTTTGSLNLTGDVTASIFAATNNGNGTNFKVGDDAWIGDINVANTIGIKGQQNATNAYVKFGSGSSNPILGSSGTNTLELTGALSLASGSVILTTGSITMPNRPAFRVTGAGGGKTAVTVLSGSYLNVDYQQGGGWDNATGTFTAPIAGLYQVDVVVRTNSNSLGTISQLIVYKNNTSISPLDGTTQIMVEFAPNTTMNHAGGSTIAKLAAGDTLKMVVTVGQISFDSNDNFSVAYIG